MVFETIPTLNEIDCLIKVIQEIEKKIDNVWVVVSCKVSFFKNSLILSITQSGENFANLIYYFKYGNYIKKNFNLKI